MGGGKTRPTMQTSSLSNALYALASACYLSAASLGIGLPIGHLINWARWGVSLDYETTRTFLLDHGWKEPAMRLPWLPWIIDRYVDLPLVVGAALPLVAIGIALRSLSDASVPEKPNHRGTRRRALLARPRRKFGTKRQP
jgi:hypothetical protein